MKSTGTWASVHRRCKAGSPRRPSKASGGLVPETAWAGFLPDESRECGIELNGTKAGLSRFPARLYCNTADGYRTTQLSNLKPLVSEDPVHHFAACILDGKKSLVPREESLKVRS